MTELVVERGALADAVTFAAKTLPRNPMAPVLTGLRLTAKDGKVTASSFDYEVYAAASAPCDGPDVDYLVPGSALARYLAGMAGESVSLVFEQRNLHLSSGSMQATLPRLPLEEYPAGPPAPPAIGQVDAEVLRTALDSVRDCIDPNSPNAGRRGYVLLLTAPLVVAGVHPQRLAMREVAWTGALDASAVVPVASLEAARAFAGDVTLGYEEGRLSLSDGDRRIVTRLVDAEPGNFLPMFNLPAPIASVTFDRAEMVAVLRWLTVNDTRKQAWGALSFDIGTDAVTLSVVGTETGATTTVSAKVDGDPQLMGWLAPNLIGGLSATDAEAVTLTVQHPSRAALLTADDDPTFRYIAQPWRLPSS